MHRSIAVLSRNASVNANYALSLVTELRRLRLSGVVPLDIILLVVHVCHLGDTCTESGHQDDRVTGPHTHIITVRQTAHMNARKLLLAEIQQSPLKQRSAVKVLCRRNATPFAHLKFMAQSVPPRQMVTKHTITDSSRTSNVAL